MKDYKYKLEFIPLHAIIYSIISSFILGIDIVLLILRFKYLIYTIDPFYLICTFLICITFIVMCISSLFDWNRELKRIFFKKAE